MWLISSIDLWPTYVSKENTDLCIVSIDTHSISLEFQMAKIQWLAKSMLAGYVPVEWNFSVCMMFLTLSTADLIEIKFHKTRKMELSATTFSHSYRSVSWTCYEPRLQPWYIWVSYLWSCCSTDFLTGLLPEVVCDSSSQCHSKASCGAVVHGMRAGDTSAATYKLPLHHLFHPFSQCSLHAILFGKRFPFSLRGN